MAWRIVVQPDGKYASFSDIVTNFTQFCMSRAEAVEYCFAEIWDGETHYLEQCRRLNVKPRMLHPKEWSPEPEGVWRQQAEEKVARAEKDPGRWPTEIEHIERCHGKRELKLVLAYVDRGQSTWPHWLAHLEKERRFKKDDRVIPKIRGVELEVLEVLPRQWYLLGNASGPVGRWREWELDPMPAAVRA